MLRWDGKSNEGMYETFIMGVTVEGVYYEVVEWLKCSVQEWSKEVIKTKKKYFVKSWWEENVLNWSAGTRKVGGDFAMTTSLKEVPMR